MKMKKFLLLLLAAVMSLSVFTACAEKTSSNGANGPSGGETIDRNVTDYGVEVFEPFTIPVTPVGEDSVSVTDAEGKAVEVTVDAQNRITFTVIGDYTLVVEAADGTHTYSLYVRDTKAPVFGSVTQVTSCLVGDTFDLTKLNTAVDDYSEVTLSYQVYHMAATAMPVSKEGTFFAEKPGYYIVVTKAEDESGNYWTYRSKIWCGSVDENEINSFDDIFLLEATSGTFSDEIRMGSEGKSLKITVSGADNSATCGHPRDLSEVRDIYYWVYIDSNSWHSERNDGGVLPEITRVEVIPTIPGWSRTALADLEFDTWIPMVMKRNSGTAPLSGDTIKFAASNRESLWGLDTTSTEDAWGAFSGYTYDIYIDNLTYTYEEEIPASPKLAYDQGDTQIWRSDTVAKIDKADITLPEGYTADNVTLSADFSKSNIVRVNAEDEEIGYFEVVFVQGTMLQDFSAGSDSFTNDRYSETQNGYGSTFFPGAVQIGYEGSSLGITMDPNGSLGRMSYISATKATEIYYYVYFDSSSFSVREGSPVKELPTLTENRVKSIKPAGWTGSVVDPSSIGWDKWILVKATRTTNDEITSLSWYIENGIGAWGVSGTFSGGCLNCKIYVDDMFTL